ncbi:MAG: apolipoprotein N-acyltransferase [Cytophagales bacterium]|nr:apolipoprotein N-acyltransferase [Cytophagales bacterium]
MIFVLPALSAVLLSLAWYLHPVCIFFGFVPILMLVEHFRQKHIRFRALILWCWLYLIFLIWNVATTWWIVNSTMSGAIMAFTLNSLFMTIPVMLYYHISNTSLKNEALSKLKNIITAVLFVSLWTAYEYLHHRWDLSWPWLTLGNVLAMAHPLAQWYEYTGTMGGTVWILTVNYLLFYYLQHKSSIHLAYPGMAFTLPVVISLFMYYNHTDKGIKANMVVVQPNIDPYKEKFSGTPEFIPYSVQLQRLINLSKSKIDSATVLVAWPETSLPHGYDEDVLSTLPVIDTLWNMCKGGKDAVLLTGADTYKIYTTEYDKTVTSRFIQGYGWFDYFNTAVLMEPMKKNQYYHKCKLVPGVEQMPFLHLFPILETFAINMGGITGSLGRTNDKTTFVTSKGQSYVPCICYESIYGELLSRAVKDGGKAIIIITNDGWWGHTPGHVQHFEYAKLRAIETRKSVARAANTGISCFINQRGDVLQKSEYWKQDVLKNEVYLNNNQTIYSLAGDYLGVVCLAVSLLALVGYGSNGVIFFVKKLFKASK